MAKSKEYKCICNDLKKLQTVANKIIKFLDDEPITMCSFLNVLVVALIGTILSYEQEERPYIMKKVIKDIQEGVFYNTINCEDHKEK